MKKEVWKAGNFLYPIPAVMVSCGTMQESNIITIAWTGILNTDPAMLSISIKPQRYSHSIIKQKKEFVVNLTNEALAYATDWCGVKSGKEVDKFKALSLTKQKAKFVSCPMIAESPVSIECKVEKIEKLGSHDMFLAKVLAIHAGSQYFSKTGGFDIAKCNLIAYANGGYYTLGKKVGKFGFSVEKKKNKR